jgi:hypothetical protein
MTIGTLDIFFEEVLELELVIDSEATNFTFSMVAVAITANTKLATRICFTVSNGTWQQAWILSPSQE